MARVSASQTVANLGIDLDKKSLKVVNKAFKDMGKYYEDILKKMNKGDKDREKQIKQGIGKTLNDYTKMFRQVQKGSDSIDWSNMATGANAVVELASKAIGLLNKGNERTKNLIESAKSLEDFAYSMQVSSESIQVLQEAGKDLHLGEGDIRGFISSLNSAGKSMQRGEYNDQTATLQRLGVNAGDSTDQIINKVLGGLSKQDVDTRQRLLNNLGISDDNLQGFTELTSKDQKQWNAVKTESAPRVLEDETTREAFEVDRRLEKTRGAIDKEWLGGDTLSSYEKNATLMLSAEKESNKILGNIYSKLSEVSTFLQNLMPTISNMVDKITQAMDLISNIFGKIATSPTTAKIGGWALDGMKTLFNYSPVGLAFNYLTEGA